MPLASVSLTECTPSAERRVADEDRKGWVVKRNSHRMGMMFATLCGVYGTSVATYSIVENRGVFDSAWWGLMTLTTVGYGDEYPHSTLGRVMGIALVVSAVFVIVPTLTAYIASRFIVDGNEWTHDEQEEVKNNIRLIMERLEV